MRRVGNEREGEAMWTAAAVLIITIVGVVVISACVAVGFTGLVWPAVIAVLLLLIALWLVRRALRPADDIRAPEMPWYATVEGPPRARRHSTGTAGRSVSRVPPPRSQRDPSGNAILR